MATLVIWADAPGRIAYLVRSRPLSLVLTLDLKSRVTRPLIAHPFRPVHKVSNMKTKATSEDFAVTHFMSPPPGPHFTP